MPLKIVKKLNNKINLPSEIETSKNATKVETVLRCIARGIPDFVFLKCSLNRIIRLQLQDKKAQGELVFNFSVKHKTSKVPLFQFFSCIKD